ncbi:MAG TPA: hypothetical protein PK142_02640 [bacterium]|nr:hypothetical protein [bacterium]
MGKKNKNDNFLFTRHKIDNEIKKNDIKKENIEKENVKEDLVHDPEETSEKDLKLTSKDLPKNSRFSESEIESNLMDIYSDDGDLPDFKTIKIKKKRGFWVSLFYFVLFFSLVAGASFWAFNYFRGEQNNSSVLDISIISPEKISLGEEFYYEIEYKNSSNYNLNNVNLSITYPDNFILLEVYSIDKTEDNKNWVIESLGAKIGGKIKIRGKMINKEGINNLFSIKSSYEISGISSNFGKESFNSVMVSSLPFQFQEDYFSTVLVGEEYPLKITLKDFPFDKIKDFVISFDGPEEIFSVKNIENKDFSEVIIIEKINDNNFKITPKTEDISVEKMEFDFKYKISEKRNDQESFSWNLKYIDESQKEFVFLEKPINLEIIKSDLHLSLSQNDSSTDFPINFGDNIDYVIKYSNKGDKNMKDLVIMAVLDSNFLDWSSLKDSNNGKISRKTISWSSQEIPGLKELAPGEGGEIKFSIKVSDFDKIDFGQNLEIKNYAQFSIGNIEELEEDGDRLTDNRSNTIINKINSDLVLEEKVLYFDEDNIPVGSGPLPPVVGEKTSFKYYWSLSNTLHELRDIKIELNLPAYVIWEDSFSISAGNIMFDPVTNKVIWTLSRWPLGIEKVDVNFSVSITPTESEYNKIMILSSGSSLEATDIETGSIINKKTEAKTSRLEDDSIASFSNDGRVR